PSCDDGPPNSPIAPPIPAGSQPAFCLEPQYTGPCRARKIRYFYNAKSGHCEIFIYGGCRGKKNNFLTAEDCMKTCGGHAEIRGQKLNPLAVTAAQPGIAPDAPELGALPFPEPDAPTSYQYPLPSCLVEAPGVTTGHLADGGAAGPAALEVGHAFSIREARLCASPGEQLAPKFDLTQEVKKESFHVEHVGRARFTGPLQKERDWLNDISEAPDLDTVHSVGS
ncbi:hypothetical protein E2I00_020175, partial [Balaenoptera physalus]